MSRENQFEATAQKFVDEFLPEYSDTDIPVAFRDMLQTAWTFGVKDCIRNEHELST